MVRIVGFSVTLIAVGISILHYQWKLNRLERTLDAFESDMHRRFDEMHSEMAEQLYRFRLRA